MKRELVFGCGAVLLVVGAACAGAEEDPSAEPGPDVVLTDGSSPSSPGETPDEDGAIEGPGCSPAGWCATSLPDPDLTLKDIWPLAGHAFAIAESPTRGVKVLEWSAAAAKWVYIDDTSQNAFGTYAGRIWAPSKDEVYFAVQSRRIFHGKRTNAGWTWTHQQLEDRVPQYPASNGDHYKGRPTFTPTNTTYVALGVFGTAADDVYAWYANTIYHATKDENGNESWEVEYVADDRDGDTEQLFFIGATATGKGDVWFSGGRAGAPAQGGCAILVHKTPAGYRRVADGERTTGGIVSGDGGIGFPPPGDGGVVLPPPADGGIGFPPPGDGGVVFPPPADGGIVFPPPGDGGIVFPPFAFVDGELTPSDGGIVFPPPADGGIVFPPPLDGGISMGDGGIVIPPPLDGGISIGDGGIAIGGDGGGGTVSTYSCKARPGTVLLGTTAGWLAGVEATATGQVVSLKGGREVVRVTAEGSNYAVEVAPIPGKPSNKNFVSIWTAPNESIWLGGPNILLRGSQDLTKGGTYEISTLSLTGGWLDTPIYQVRGSSNIDRWAIGARHALHKTTP